MNPLTDFMAFVYVESILLVAIIGCAVLGAVCWVWEKLK